MEIDKFPYYKEKEYISVKGYSPLGKLVFIEGFGIYYANITPGKYLLQGNIKADTFFIKNMKKIDSQNVINKFLDNYLRKHALTFNDYALSTALILNNRDYISPQIKKAFTDTGMLHILAISGGHIALIFFIISLIISVFYVPRKFNFIISSSIILFYAYILDFTPSAFRACLFAIVYSFSQIFERKVNIFNIFGLTLILNLFLNPLDIYDIGFQLSYLAVLGIILSPFEYHNNFFGLLKVSISAQILITPALLYYFQKAPILYVFANFLTIPISSLLIINVLLCLFFGFFEQLWYSLHILIGIFVKIILMLESLNVPALKFNLDLKSYVVSVLILFIALLLWRIRYLFWNLLKALKTKKVVS
jgi:competence protein ComEC